MVLTAGSQLVCLRSIPIGRTEAKISTACFLCYQENEGMQLV